MNLGIGESKLGFLSENGVFPESWVCCELSKLAMASNLWPWRVKQYVQLAMASKWLPWRVAQYNNSCFCRFRVLGSIRTIL